MMIGITILIEIVIILLGILFWYLACNKESIICGVLAFICFVALFVTPVAIGKLHGYIDYNASNDKDLARITAVTQEQTMFRTYYRVEVEYLTNTPQQEGVITNNRIEKDTFYCYYDDKELVKKLKNNQYKEVWIITGYKGGYESWKDFGTKLIKNIEPKEE